MVDFNDAFNSMGKFGNQALDALGRNDGLRDIGSRFNDAGQILRRVGREGVTLRSILNIGDARTPTRSESNNNKQVESTDSSYLVTLTAKNLNASVFGFTDLRLSAYMPANYSMQFGSSWAAPFDKSFGEALAGLPAGSSAAGKVSGALNKFAPVLNIGTQVFGTANRHKLQTAHIWQNGQPLSLSVPFHFAANVNTYDDVLRHFRTLSMLASPREEDGILYPPGPTLAGAAIEQAKQLYTGKVPASEAFSGADLSGLGGTIMSIQLGEFAIIEPIIIESVDSAIDTLNDPQGKPMFMAINVNIKTYYTVSANDIHKMMNHPLLRYSASGERNPAVRSQAQSAQPMLLDDAAAKYATNSNGDYNG